jgi:hypothetical protein
LAKPSDKRIRAIEELVSALPDAVPDPSDEELTARIIEVCARNAQHDFERRAVGTWWTPKRMSERDVAEAEKFAKANHAPVEHYLSHDEVSARCSDWEARLPSGVQARIAARTSELIQERADGIAASKASTARAKAEGLARRGPVETPAEKGEEPPVSRVAVVY